MNWPEVTICICTYDRADEICQTVSALREKLVYPALRWLIADDSSPSNYAAKLKKRAAFKDLDAHFSVTPRNSGWGANVNHALGQVTTEYVFFLEDDYVLTRELDLRAGVALLEANKGIGMLRYRGTSGEHMVYHQHEIDLPDDLADTRQGLGLPGKLSYYLIDSGSYSAYVYSHGPHLKHRRFHAFYGAYPEGKKLGETEESFAVQTKGKMKESGAPAIAILPDWTFMWFEHIGRSYQGSDKDKGE